MRGGAALQVISCNSNTMGTRLLNLAHRYQGMRQQAMQARREQILQAELPSRGMHVERSTRQISLLVSAVVHRVRPTILSQ
jgi:hypothetical protein